MGYGTTIREMPDPNIDSVYNDGGLAFTIVTRFPLIAALQGHIPPGLYPTEHGVWNNVNVGNTISRGLVDGIYWSVPLSQAGYRLYHSGKWHVSAEVGPEEFGWINIYGNERYDGKGP